MRANSAMMKLSWTEDNYEENYEENMKRQKLLLNNNNKFSLKWTKSFNACPVCSFLCKVWKQARKAASAASQFPNPHYPSVTWYQFPPFNLRLTPFFTSWLFTRTYHHWHPSNPLSLYFLICLCSPLASSGSKVSLKVGTYPMGITHVPVGAWVETCLVLNRGRSPMWRPAFVYIDAG